MATAIVSALRNQPVREDVAMTGEITLSGLVLPVGGIREKALAARRHGIKTLILPALNATRSRGTPSRSAKWHAVRAGVDTRRCSQGRPACRRYPYVGQLLLHAWRIDCRGFVRPRRCARRSIAGQRNDYWAGQTDVTGPRDAAAVERLPDPQRSESRHRRHSRNQERRHLPEEREVQRRAAGLPPGDSTGA